MQFEYLVILNFIDETWVFELKYLYSPELGIRQLA